MGSARLFPHSDIRNIKLFYLINACAGSFFCAPIWLFFFTRYISLGEVGIADWGAVVAAWVAEVPSGILADTFGRRRLIIIAMFFCGIGIGLQGFAFNLHTFLITNVIYLVGFSFYSGAGEALAYESLRGCDDQDKAYERVISTARSVEFGASLVSVMVGAYLYQLAPSLPFFVQGFFFCLGGVFAWRTTETMNMRLASRQTAARKPRNLLKESFRLIDRKLFPAALICVAALGLYDMICWSFLRTAIATKFGYGEVGYAVILNLGIVSVMLTTRLLPAVRARLGDRLGFPGFGFLLGLSVALCAVDFGYHGAGFMIVMTVLGNFLKPWLSIIANAAASDINRATLISLFGLGTRIPFLVLGAILPYIAEQGFFNYSLIALGGVAMLCAVISWSMSRSAST
jgi:MFS family permease